MNSFWSQFKRKSVVSSNIYTVVYNHYCIITTGLLENILLTKPWKWDRVIRSICKWSSQSLQQTLQVLLKSIPGFRLTQTFVVFNRTLKMVFVYCFTLYHKTVVKKEFLLYEAWKLSFCHDDFLRLFVNVLFRNRYLGIRW